MFTQLDAKKALLQLVDLKGKPKAQLIERMFRLETAHFVSKQYQLSASSGMEDGKWPNLKPGSYTTFQMLDNHIQGPDKMRTFIKWNSVLDAMLYLSDYIDRWKGNYGRWNSTNIQQQQKYVKSVSSIKNQWIV